MWRPACGLSFSPGGAARGPPSPCQPLAGPLSPGANYTKSVTCRTGLGGDIAVGLGYGGSTPSTSWGKEGVLGSLGTLCPHPCHTCPPPPPTPHPMQPAGARQDPQPGMPSRRGCPPRGRGWWGGGGIHCPSQALCDPPPPQRLVSIPTPPPPSPAHTGINNQL